jgi:hypothetical protein
LPIRSIVVLVLSSKGEKSCGEMRFDSSRFSIVLKVFSL